MIHRSKPPRAVRLGIVLASLGAAAAMTTWAATAAGAATPGKQGANTRQSKSQAAVQPDATKTAVICEKPGSSHSIQVGADLSDTKVSATWNKSDPTKLIFAVKAAPVISLKLNFSGDAECQADLAPVEIPLGKTGLMLQFGPKLDFSTTGTIGADFTWKPTTEVGFTIDHTKFVNGPLSFSNGPGIAFTGSGTASVRLDLRAVIETASGVTGVEGDFGPTITAQVHGPTVADTACWTAGVAADADFETNVSSFGFKQKFGSKWQPTKASSAAGCLAKTIIFDGSPETKTPPAKLGPYPMKAFAKDSTAEGTVESKIAGPTGALTVSPGLVHDLVGSDWQTWSNSYPDADVYQDSAVLPDGNLQVTVILPASTGAFYAYVEPDKFDDYAINATANNGATSGNITVNGDAGARYFGFYATCGHTVKSVTYIDSGGDTMTALGEFGIAPARAC